ncbi:hypothetical protein HDE_09079 [Halotydeus destructor]|nr:hypothetical protein HDE_09079 [Halotydeus destructor]
MGCSNFVLLVTSLVLANGQQVPGGQVYYPQQPVPVDNQRPVNNYSGMYGRPYYASPYYYGQVTQQQPMVARDGGQYGYYDNMAVRNQYGYPWFGNPAYVNPYPYQYERNTVAQQPPSNPSSYPTYRTGNPSWPATEIRNDGQPDYVFPFNRQGTIQRAGDTLTDRLRGARNFSKPLTFNLFTLIVMLIFGSVNSLVRK